MSGGPVSVRRLGLLVFGVAFLLLFVIVAIAEGIGDPSVPDGDVALVEQVPDEGGGITKAQFDRALVQTAAQSGQKKVPKPGDEQYDELKEAALSALLDIVWLRGQAAEMGVFTSEGEVEEEFKKLKEENFKTPAEYKRFLKESKFTQEDVNERVELQVLSGDIQELITERAPEPSQDEVENYYEAAKGSQFTQPATRDVRLVVNKKEAKANEALAALQKDDSPANWKKIAKKFSEDDATKDKGGLQKGLAEGGLEEPLNEEVFNTPEGRVEGLVKTDRGFYVFEVVNSTPESVQELSAVESQIKSQLEQQAQQDAFSEFLAGYTGKWTSRTFCASGYTTERCANFEGEAHPASAPPGCYEADPKEPVEACPAPVFQLIPAMPGTVTPLEPRGTPLAQRPRPVETAAAATTPTEGLPLPTTP